MLILRNTFIKFYIINLNNLCKYMLYILVQTCVNSKDILNFLLIILRKFATKLRLIRVVKIENNKTSLKLILI